MYRNVLVMQIAGLIVGIAAAQLFIEAHPETTQAMGALIGLVTGSIGTFVGTALGHAIYVSRHRRNRDRQ